MIFYGLKNLKTDRLIAFDVHSNGDDAEFCGDCTVTLIDYIDNDDTIWMVKTQDIAEKAKVSTGWYNSDINTPTHKYKIDDLQVVKITLDIQDV